MRFGTELSHFLKDFPAYSFVAFKISLLIKNMHFDMVAVTDVTCTR